MVLLLTIWLVLSSIPSPGCQAAEDAFTIVQPVVVFSGQGIIADGIYTADNISLERSYTLDELKAIAAADPNAAAGNRYLYSAYNTVNNATLFLGEGVRLNTLLQKAGVTEYSSQTITLIAPDKYKVIFDPSKTTVGVASSSNTTQHFAVTRYCYPNLKAAGAGNTDGAVEVPSIIAWAQGGQKGSMTVPTTVTEFTDRLESMIGQIALNDFNHPLFNGDVNKIQVGGAITTPSLTINDTAFTRSEILMMERADRVYTYPDPANTTENITEYVRGVPLRLILDKYDDNDIVSFITADNDPEGGFSMTLADLTSGNYLLGYEKGTGTADLKGIYETAPGNASIYGCFSLYGDGMEPVGMISSISVEPVIDFSISPYKHITNGGLSGQTGPYDLAALTDADLAIEGPGVAARVALPVSVLESQNDGAYRGVYTDTRGETSTTLQYEGIKLSHLLNNMTDAAYGIEKTGNADKVVLKNQLNQTIAQFTLEQIAAAEAAGKPVIIAYGTGTIDTTPDNGSDDSIVAPFVLNEAEGIKAELGNDDGPLKLVYDKTAFSADPNPAYTRFGNVAVIYVDIKAGSTDPNEEVPGKYDLLIDGPGVSKTNKYTLAQLKSAASGYKQTRDYDWLNNYGTRGNDEVEGIYLEDLLDNIIGLSSNALSITVTGSDGFHRSFELDSNVMGVYWTDKQGNKMMLAWKRNGKSSALMLAVGQSDDQHINKSYWVDDIETITVNTVSADMIEDSPNVYDGNNNNDAEKDEIEPAAGYAQTVGINVAPSIRGGVANATVSPEDIEKIMKEVKNSQGSNARPGKVLLVIDAASESSDEDVQSSQVTLPADTMKALANSDNVTVSIKTDLGEILLPADVLRQLAAKGGQSVVVSISISSYVPAAEGDETIGDRPVVDISIARGGKEIDDLGGSRIRAGISYLARSNENQSQLLAYYINDNGQTVPVKLSRFDGESNQMLLATVHLSLYAVGCNEVSFADIEKHWAQNNIEFLAAREIIKGKSAGRFDPDGNVTRAEFVTMLANSLDNTTVTGYRSSGLDDIAAGAWYADFVNWAVANGIVSGFGDGNFRPNDLITREQMAVMMYNFTKATGAELDLVKDKKSFTDEDKISSWSAEAITRMQQSGIINGRTDGSFSPQGTSTRAEAATVIKSYLEALLK
jgi:hypothetical protein